MSKLLVAPGSGDRAPDGVAGVMEDARFRERYELLNQIGAGAFAKVYRATQRSTGQDVAVKILALDDALDDGPIDLQIARFRREVEVCSRLSHPNIVRLVDSGEGPRHAIYAVFAHVPGWNLADLLTLQGPLPYETALYLMGQVLDALACAHANGVVHRDIKPDNIVITSTGARPNAMVLDFGIGVLAGTTGRWGSRMTLRGEPLGTPAYSAPEQLRGEPVSGAADLYAWGLTTIEVLTGNRVMAGATLQETIFRQLGPDPVPIPEQVAAMEIGALLRDVCDKDVDRRPTDAKVVLGRLQAGRGAPQVALEPLIKLPVGASSALPSKPRKGIATIPLLRNPHFKGRADVLGEIADKLRTSALLAVCALKGMGGVGKTQLALEYAYRHLYDYDLVAWIRAEDPGTLDADFAQLASTLALPEAQAPEDHRRIKAAHDWLENHDRWLLVFDNALEPRVIRPYLPRNDAGHVLITSRNQSWHSLARSVAVDVMSPAEAVQLLLERSGSDDEASARALAELLGYLPLALEEAAAYVEVTGRTLGDYIRLFREHQSTLLAASLPPADYPATLRTTWDLSLERLSREEPRAVELLSILAHLGPEHLPRALLTPLGRARDDRSARGATDEVAVDRQLAALLRYSLVRAEDDELFVHRLLQAVMRDRLSADERTATAEQALHLVEAAFPRSGTAGRARPECTRLLPHAITVLGHARQIESCRIPAARLLRRTGVYSSACGWSDDAVKHLERSRAIFHQAGPDYDGELAQASADLGMVHYQLGQLEAAAKGHLRAVGTFAHGPHQDPVRAAQALINLAWVRWSEGALAAAEESARRSVELLRSMPEGGGLNAVGALSILARVLYESGLVREARGVLDEAVALLSSIPGPHHPLLCGTLLQVAQMQAFLGRPAEGAAFAAAGLRAGERAYGQHHPLVAGTHSVLGQIHRLLGDEEAARMHFTEAVASARTAPNQIDQQVALAACFLVQTLLGLGRIDEAERALDAAETLLAKICGARGQFAAGLHLARARLDLVSGKADVALEQCENGYALLVANLGGRHPATVDALLLMGDARVARGDLAGASEAFTAALALAAAYEMGEHPMLIAVHAALAALHERAGRHAEAAVQRDRVRALRAALGASVARAAQGTAGGAPGAR